MSGRKKDQQSSAKDRDRSRSPVPTASRSESFTKDDLMEMMSQTMTAQLPRLIMETSKVVAAQMASENEENVRSFTSMSQEMKRMKLRQEEVSAQARAGALKSDGARSYVTCLAF